MTKKAARAAALDVEVLETEPPLTPPVGGEVKVKEITTRQYTEKPPVGAPPPGGEAAAEEDLPWEDSEEEEALEDFFSSGEAYTIRVERISDSYATTGQTSLRTTAGVWCDDIPLTRDYRQVIKLNFGPGIYRLLLKGGTGQRIRKHQILKIAAPINSMVPQPGQSHLHVIQQQPPGQPFDPIDVLRSQTKMVRELFELTRELTPPQPAIVNGSPEVAIQLAEQTGKLKMMETLLAHPDKSLSERLITKMFGEPESDKSWVPELIELGKTALQALPDLMRMFAPSSAGVPAAPNPEPGTRNPERGALPPDQRSPSQIAYARTMHAVVEGMYYDDVPTIAIAALDQLVRRYEEMDPEILAMMTREPAVVVETLINNNSRLAPASQETKDHWAGWIGRMQEQWKSEPPDGETHDGQQA